MAVATAPEQVGTAQGPVAGAAAAPSADDAPPPQTLGNLVMPWAISVTFHVGLGLVGAFLFFAAHAQMAQAQQSIIVPQSFEDPAYSEHPGGNPNAGAGDPLQQAAQDRLKQLAKSEGWTNKQSTQDLVSLLGNSGENQAMAILAGSGASLGKGKDGTGSNAAAAALYGPSAGAGAGPRSSFYGTGGNATKIVYILDCSGSMLDNFDFLKAQATKSVNNLVPVQYFAVIMVSDQTRMLMDGGLQKAVPENKKHFAEAIRSEYAEGKNDDLLAPFAQAFDKAFALNPELIYFLTDGRFGEGLVSKVTQMNRDKRVHINTIAFVTEEPAYKQQLEQLARDNGGTYKFIPEKDLAK